MKFLINANLPLALIQQLNALGYDATHTRDMPKGNQSIDKEICALSIREQRILITKDRDFLDTFFVKQGPYKLLLVTTGNISNYDLEELLFRNIEQIERAFDEYDFIELNRTELILHQ